MRCEYKKSDKHTCGSYAFNLHHDGIEQGKLCDVHYYKQKRDELLAISIEIPNWIGGEWADKLRAATLEYKPIANASK